MISRDIKIFILGFFEKRPKGVTWYNLEVALSRAGFGGEVNALELMTQLVSEDMLSVSARSEEHTSELQSHLNLVCRLLLEKKNNYLGDTDRFETIANLHDKCTVIMADVPFLSSFFLFFVVMSALDIFVFFFF